MFLSLLSCHLSFWLSDQNQILILNMPSTGNNWHYFSYLGNTFIFLNHPTNLSGNLIQTKSYHNRSVRIMHLWVLHLYCQQAKTPVINYTNTAITSSFDLIPLSSSMPINACLNATSTATCHTWWHHYPGANSQWEPTGGESIAGHHNNIGQSAQAERPVTMVISLGSNTVCVADAPCVGSICT